MEKCCVDGFEAVFECPGDAFKTHKVGAPYCVDCAKAHVILTGHTLYPLHTTPEHAIPERQPFHLPDTPPRRKRAQ